MLSILAIISIFIEIFACGILLGAAFVFFKKFFQAKRSQDMCLAFLFSAFAAYIGLTLISQMMRMLDAGLTELIFIHKIIAVNMVAASALIWSVSAAKFDLCKRGVFRALSFVVALSVLGIIFLIIASPVSLIYRHDVIEPVVDFSLVVPVRFLWVIAWAFFGALSFSGAFKNKGGARNLLFLSGSAAIFVLLAEVSKFLYVTTADSTYLLFSWTLIFFSSVFLFTGESIPPESPLAGSPLNFFRSRILFKLLLIFVLLIVILLEATTLATININRMALSEAIKKNYMETARNLADKIEFQAVGPDGMADQKKVQEFVEMFTAGQRYAYVVDKNGSIIAHSDEIRVKLKDSIRIFAPIDDALNGVAGAQEFHDETGAEKVGAFVPVRNAALVVVIEEPIRSAYSAIRRLEVNTLLFVITGIFLTVIVGIFFAMSIERPIHEVIIGTRAVRKGELDHKINVSSLDEIGKLAEAFNLMTSELRESQEHLVTSEKLAALGTLAAGAAHEIKNPLVALRTFTQLLQQKFDDPEFRKKFAAIVPQEIERINRIAENLLKFGKPIRPELSGVNVSKILDEVIEMLENECRRYDIRVTTKFASLPEIIGDSNQLKAAFVNIVLNAIQAMSASGGELIVKTDIGEVIRIRHTRPSPMFGKSDEHEEVSEDAKYLVKEAKPIPVIFVEITDTGPGIEEENLKGLFDPFFTTKMSGTGMGLSITLRIIEAHGGSIKVKSQVGKGTTFIITLPLKSEK